MNFQATDIFLFLAIFARLGSMIMMFPVFGEVTVSPRARLGIALACTLLLMPSLRSHYPAMSSDIGPLLGLIFCEMFIGILIGGTARLITSALQVAGNIISMQTGLSFAQNFDPTQGIQGAIVGTFLSLIAMTMVVATDTDHLL